LVLYDGAVGSRGNSAVTGTFIVATTLAVALSNRWRDFRPNLCDVAFLAYAGSITVSTGINGISDGKEMGLMIIALASYPACRMFAGSGVSKMFVFVTLAIAVAGSVVTGVELIKQWNDHFAKVLILGVGAFAVNFLTSLGFAMIAMTCVKLTRFQLWVSVVLIIPATAIFAASMVRGAFFAILGSLALSAYLAAPAARRQISIVMLAMVVGISAGLTMRFEKTAGMADLAVEGLATIVAGVPTDEFGNPPRIPTCATGVNPDDSIGIRIGLVRDALAVAKTSGWFGIGLNGFMNRTCLNDHEVHNSFLQAVIEFGWTGGIALIVMLVTAAFHGSQAARSDPEARFALCSLAFAAVMAFGSGRTSRDTLLFLFMGLAAGFHVKHNRPRQDTPLVRG
jgi:hypothetical protein